MRVGVAIGWLVACGGTEEGKPAPTAGGSDPSTPSTTTATTPSTTTSSSGPTDTAEAPVDSGTPPATVPDFSQPGPGTFVETAELWSPGGLCVTPTTTYVPDTPATAVTVVLAHGFSRTEGAIEDLARHLATWGVPVVTLTMCHATPLTNDPEADAADLIALADRVGAGDRLYVGHSAGGLRSVLAGVDDPLAIGVLGLDLVDVFRLAERAAPDLTVPFAGVAGEPYDCNSDGNGDAVFAAAPGSTLLHVTDADHCDFEWPTDWMCTALCDQPGARSDADIRAVVRGTATAWVVWRSGADPRGEAYWTAGGSVHDALVASGAVR